MIANPLVWEEDHLPHTLEHRDAELQQVTRAFEPAVEGDRAEDLLISGPSGVGKTVLTRFALDRLHGWGDIDSTLIPALGQTTGSVLRKIIDDLDVDADVHRGTPTAELVPTLQEGIDRPAILVLDEADDVHETNLLESLGDVPLLSVVCICHDPDEWLSAVGSDHRAAFGGEQHLSLTRYRVDELADILEHRANEGLHDGAVSRGDLMFIADEVAGVARRGIQSLRAAAEIATEEGHESIRRDDIERGFERARDTIRESNLQSLPFHYHVVYEVVRQNGPLTGRGLHLRYDDVAEHAYARRPQQPVSKGYRRKILRKLEEYDLVESEKTGGSSRYWPVEQTLRSEIGELDRIDEPSTAQKFYNEDY